MTRIDSITYPTEYALNEIIRFHELMGYRSFWKTPETASNALKGLLYLYNHAEDPKAIESHIVAATEEYDRRLFYFLLNMKEHQEYRNI